MKTKKIGRVRPRKISRREFLKTAAGVGAIAAGPSVFHILGRRSYAAGKTARALLIPSPLITPGAMNSANAANTSSCIYDWLFRLEGKEQKFVNSLAESVEHSKDMSRWTFKLREKVKFHHGTELTADDVLFTVDRWLQKLGAPIGGMFTHLDKVEKVDRYVARFNLKRPDPDFLVKFLDYNAAILAHDYDYKTHGNTKPSGTGAFKVANYSVGQRMLLERNRDYFIPDLPKVDNLEFSFIPETQTQVMMLESGEADIIRYLGLDYVTRYQNHPTVDLQTVESAWHHTIAMRCDQPPFDDNRVRLAMKYCVDRPKMLKSAAYGYGILANDNPIWPKNIWYTDIGMRERNIDKAKELLAQAGYPKGLDVEIFCSSNFPPALEQVLTFQEMAKDAGIIVQVRASTRDIYLAKYWQKVSCQCTDWGHRENPLDLVSVNLISTAPWNESHYKNPDFDKLVNDAMTEADPVRRKEIFKKIEILLSEEGPSIIPFFYNSFAAVRKGVKGFQVTRNMINDYRFVDMG